MTRLRFPIANTDPNVDVESAEVRLLAPPTSGKDSVQIQVYQILGPRRRRFLEERQIYLSQKAPKWLEFDVTNAAQSWLSGERNLGLEVECSGCVDGLRPIQAALSVLVYPELRRSKRSSQYYESNRRSDCKGEDKKQRCCRHEMTVIFKNLKVPQMDSIIQPKFYEAGYCKGRCPPNFNYATNHSRIQSLVHRMDRTKPRVCCAPSKLEPLEILRVDPYDHSKLTVEKWDNMKVLECACS